MQNLWIGIKAVPRGKLTALTILTAERQGWGMAHMVEHLIPWAQSQVHTPTRCLWLTPVILPTQEAEIRRIMVQSQPRQIIQKTLFWKKTHHKNRASVPAQGESPEFKPQYCKKKKRKRERETQGVWHRFPMMLNSTVGDIRHTRYRKSHTL
jgi:hypothetical protein